MPIHDPLADGLTKIRNASRASHPTVDVAPSRFTERILTVLQQEGFIKTYKAIGETPASRRLLVYLKYAASKPAGGAASKRIPAITGLVRVSRAGVRMYRKAHELPRVLNGLGVAVVSTSRGVMTERDAYRQRVGGEVLCYVW